MVTCYETGGSWVVKHTGMSGVVKGKAWIDCRVSRHSSWLVAHTAPATSLPIALLLWLCCIMFLCSFRVRELMSARMVVENFAVQLVLI